MYLHNIARGTNLDVTFEDGGAFRCIFDGYIDHMNFYVICPDILKSIDSLINAQVKIQFRCGNIQYSFNGQIVKKSNRKDVIHETAEIKVLTAFKESPRRESLRMEMQTKIRIHDYVDDLTKFYSGDMICEGLSVDVNKNGIRIFADHALSHEPNARYTLELELRSGWPYFIPAKILRYQENKVTRSYHYDYVFLFDFTKEPEKREKLFLDIMEWKLKGKVK
ncbi:MAG: hypothetical protein FWE05_08735 [Defluviitaleaceae bacterium]|nr:hypothetical protein [Defluviitaleaceae bacterium]